MSVLLIDTETTGLDPSTARVIEIGAVVVDEEFNFKRGYSELIWGVDYPEITEEIERLTGITQDMLDKMAVPPAVAFVGLDPILEDVTEVIAYNSSFDQGMIVAELARGLASVPNIIRLCKVPWLCGMADIEAHADFKSLRLAHAALEWGITVSPRELHRAMGDVELMQKILKKSGTTVQAMREYKDTPSIYLKAHVEKPWIDGGVSTGYAKKLGYSFERAKADNSGKEFKNTWVKRVKQNRQEKELLAAQGLFNVTALA